MIFFNKNLFKCSNLNKLNSDYVNHDPNDVISEKKIEIKEYEKQNTEEQFKENHETMKLNQLKMNQLIQQKNDLELLENLFKPKIQDDVINN